MQNDYLEILGLGLSQSSGLLLVLVFAFVFIISLKLLDAKFNRKKRGRWRRSPGWRRRGGEVPPFRPRHDALPNRVPDAADQLRTVMRAEFKPQPLLNKSEARLFKAIDQWVVELRPGWQVMAQVSLGEILRCKDKDAYACIKLSLATHPPNYAGL